MRNIKPLALAGLLLASSAHASQLGLMWESTDGPAPWLLTVVSTTGNKPASTTLTPVPVLDDAACQGQAGSSYVAGKTYCAVIPCPAPGSVYLGLQADDISRPAVLRLDIADATCRLTPGAPALTPPSSQPTPATPSGGSAPSPPPTVTASPASETPPPTTQDIQTLLSGGQISDDTLQRVQVMQDQLRTLMRDYYAQLKTIQDAWKARLAQYSAAMPPAEYQRLWDDYAAAQQAQQTLYTTMQTQRQALMDAYTKLLQL